jgi:hypothetical protein
MERTTVVRLFDLEDLALGDYILAQQLICNLIGVLELVEADKPGHLGSRNFRNHRHVGTRVVGKD